MSYDFSFEKKNAVLLAACVFVIAMLLVWAGYLLGIQHIAPQASIPTPEPSPLLMEKPVSPPPAATKSIDISTEPVPVASPANVSNEQPAPAHNRKSSSTPQFSLQIGAFHSKANAEARVKTLKDQGVSATIMNKTDDAGITWFAVRAGTYPDLPSATKAARAMSAATSDFVIVRPAQSL
jgi:septal ring-binding cell division protein DamX